MSENWWVMQQIIEARERDIRAAVKRMQGQMSGTEHLRGPDPRARQGIRNAVGAALVRWGRALSAQEVREAQACTLCMALETERHFQGR